MKIIGKALGSLFYVPKGESDFVRLLRTEYRKEYDNMEHSLGRAPTNSEAKSFLYKR